MSVFRKFESLFLNSLTRKLLLALVVCATPMLVYVVWLAITFPKMTAAISASGTVLLTASELDKLLTGAFIAAAITGVLSIICLVVLRQMIPKTLLAMAQRLESIQGSNGDLSAVLPEESHDEISRVARSYNAFSDNIKGMIADTREKSVHVSLSATQLQNALGSVERSVADQESQAQLVFQASAEATQAIDEIASHTLRISEKNGSNVDEIRTSCNELSRIKAQVEQMSGQVEGFSEVVASLTDKSDTIMKVVSTVQDFSDQTNLLALNASIEAARAGDAGRGFSVVADEVRTLAQKVNEAAGEIDRNVTEMVMLVDSTRQGTDKIQANVSDTSEFIHATHDQFDHMMEDFEALNGQLSSISAAIDELAYTNRNSHDHVEKITGISAEIKEEMAESQKYSHELELATQESQELLSRFIIGFGGFEDMIQTGKQWAAEVEERLEKVASEGQNLFDREYQPTNPGQMPEKFDVSYVKRFEEVLRPAFDGFIQARPEFIYAIAVDVNGYAPAHHSKLSQPLTGDVDVDLAKSRHRRMFNGNRAETRRAQSTAPFLLQTFIRDTGEVLNDLSVPLYVNGQHWGALIMGFKPEHLLNRKAGR